jgi:hypothetical protein
MAVTTATILIPDISGYTSFISQMEIEHGSYIISQLFESIIANTDQHFTISEVEGDALLLYAKAIMLSKKVILDQCLKMFDVFHKRRKTLHESNECNCNACAGIEKLTLKFIIHYGTIFELQISRFLKPSGIDVIIAHRLLKNKIDSHEYILMTNGFLSNAEDGGENYNLIWNQHNEEFDSIGVIACHFALLNSDLLECM